MLFALTSCKTNKADVYNDPIQFQKSEFESLMELAQTEQKPLFVDFYADWCLPCKMMDKEVFNDPEVSAFFEENFINVKIDAERGQGPNLAVMYEIKGYPTLMFMNPEGRELIRQEGMAYQTELLKLAEQAIYLFENQ